MDCHGFNMNILFTTQHGNFLSVIMHVYHSLKNLDIALDHPLVCSLLDELTKKLKAKGVRYLPTSIATGIQVRVLADMPISRGLHPLSK